MRAAALFLLLVASPSFGQFRAGVATVNINPELPAWLSGFAARTRPADRIEQDIHAKALAIADANGGRAVIVTADLIGFTREVTDEVYSRLARSHKLRRSELLFNASHTHSGPSVWPRLHVAPAMNAQVDRQIQTYTSKLTDKLELLVGQALSNLRPVTLQFAIGEAGFARNRRTAHLSRIRPGETFPAPVDHSVPVMKVTYADGKVLAILFGYACHNTVLTSEFAEVSGDYAGYAQLNLEKSFPGAVALFVALCGADQGAMPRSKIELAQEYGAALASGVRNALAGSTLSLQGAVRSAYRLVDLPFQMHSREFYSAESQSPDMFVARRGRIMLEQMDAKTIPHATPYPVQAFRFGQGPAWLALGGEVVIDYQLQLKQQFGLEHVVIAGYSNDVMGYIPSRRVQHEGGYEAGDALVYFSQPGWFTEQVEDLVLDTSRKVLSDVGVMPAKQ